VDREPTWPLSLSSKMVCASAALPASVERGVGRATRDVLARICAPPASPPACRRLLHRRDDLAATAVFPSSSWSCGVAACTCRLRAEADGSLGDTAGAAVDVDARRSTGAHPMQTSQARLRVVFSVGIVLVASNILWRRDQVPVDRRRIRPYTPAFSSK